MTKVHGLPSKPNVYADLLIVPASARLTFPKEGFTISPQAFSSEEEIWVSPTLSKLMDAL
jgi:hypothetical protein